MEQTWEENKIFQHLKDENRTLKIQLQTEQQLRRQAEAKVKTLLHKEPKDLKVVTLGQIYSKIFEKGFKPNWGEAYYKAGDVIPILAKREQLFEKNGK